jgi:CHAD domain-containing protein
MPIAGKSVQFVFQKVERDLLRLSDRTQPESVHSFRTTTRRLQTLLEELLPKRDRNQKNLLKQLDRIRKRAGKVRDLDVQLGALRVLKAAQEPRRKTQLMQELIEVRAKHEKKLRKALEKETIREIRKRLKRAAKHANFEGGREPLAVAREIMSRAVEGTRTWDEVALDECRILVKRARYAAEFSTRNAESAQLIAQLKRLQDAIGNWHDWQALTHSATGRLGEVNQSSLVAALRNVTGGKFRNAIAALSAFQAVPIAQKQIPAAAERSAKPRMQPRTEEQQTNSAA